MELGMEILAMFPKEEIKSVNISGSKLDEIIVNRGGKNYRIWISPEEEGK